jgi:hypothetical protein
MSLQCRFRVWLDVSFVLRQTRGSADDAKATGVLFPWPSPVPVRLVDIPPSVVSFCHSPSWLLGGQETAEPAADWHCRRREGIDCALIVQLNRGQFAGSLC